MWAKLSFIVLIGLAVTVDYGHAGRKRYDNYRVYQLQPSNAAHIATLKVLDGSGGGSLVFLDPIYNGCTKVHVVVAPNRIAKFTAALTRGKIPYSLLNDNVQNTLDAEQLSVDTNGLTNEYNWENYQELNATYDWMRALAKKYPKQVSLFVAGKSYEGRDLLGIRIAYDKFSKANGKRSIFIEAGIHAREWISPATATYIINQLLTNRNKRVRRIAKSHVLYVLPHANPDGFVYTHTTDRLWRKNRKQYGDGNCVGVDLNRNFDFHWLEADASNDSCASTFAGPEPFSEVETRTLSEYVRSIKDELVLYMSIHSFGQTLLFPYGYTNELPANYDNLRRVANVAVEAISKRYGTQYISGISYESMYPNSGSSIDWAHGSITVPYCYSYELRPTRYPEIGESFILPAVQIIPTGEETLDSIMAMVEKIDALES